jgi:hypothetical protein
MVIVTQDRKQIVLDVREIGIYKSRAIEDQSLINVELDKYDECYLTVGTYSDERCSRVFEEIVQAIKDGINIFEMPKR